MLLRLLLSCTFFFKVSTANVTEKPKQIITVFPVPLELPNRNDRSDQCWLRIEDVEITETLVVYCSTAHKFLSYYIHDYNNRMIKADKIDVGLWYEKPRGDKKEVAYGPPGKVQNVTDWRVTTVMDPTTHTRLYVSQNAICRLIMYSREGMTNYIIDCATILYFVNVHNSAVMLSCTRLVLCIGLFLVYHIVN